jgi:hypothetical protein
MSPLVAYCSQSSLIIRVSMIQASLIYFVPNSPIFHPKESRCIDINAPGGSTTLSPSACLCRLSIYLRLLGAENVSPSLNAG